MDLGRLLLVYGEWALIAAGVLVVAGLAIWRYERHVAEHGRPGGASMGDGLGNLIDVFDPGQARASRDLKEQRNVGPVAPVPDPDPDDPLRLVLGPDGAPRSIRIRRTGETGN